MSHVPIFFKIFGPRKEFYFINSLVGSATHWWRMRDVIFPAELLLRRTSTGNLGGHSKEKPTAIQDVAFLITAQ